MAFTLDKVVPWGRNFDEYCRMFALSPDHANTRILGCGDGPACFNKEATNAGWDVISVDPLYQFDADSIRKRISEIKETVIAQTKVNRHQFIWNYFESIEALQFARLEAMDTFLSDFEVEGTGGRYRIEALPTLSFPDKTFDLALVSHFLFLYSEHLDETFHLKSIQELLRVATEVRIFPILDLSAHRSRHLPPIMEKLSDNFSVEVIKVDYEFQIGGNEMLKLRHRN